MTTKLRILTYNTHKSKNWSGQNESVESLKQFIIESEADIVFLQEVIGANKDRKIETPHFEDLADEIWDDFAYGKNATYQNGHHGNAILSRYPIVTWQQQSISNNRFEQRGLLYAKITVPINSEMIPIHLYCVHLDLLESGRKKQIAKVIERIKVEVGDDPYILAGDFNDWNLAINKILKDELNLQECFYTAHGSYAKTFPVFLPALKLDRIYISGFKINSAQVLSNKLSHHYSDHLPLMTEIIFEK